jgi:hypothetical protein
MTCLTLCGETSANEVSGFQNDIIIYPNPFHAFATLQISSQFENAQLKIYNSLGLIVRTEKMFRQTSHSLYRNELSNGLYFIQLINDKGNVANSKFIVE